jgi:hypothetical protein
VLAYEAPSAAAGGWRAGNASWPKHVLADGYKPLKAYLPGRGSPGTATPFPAPPSTQGTSGSGGRSTGTSTSTSTSTSPGDGKPWVAVSADDGGWVDVLSPLSPADPADWAYAKDRVVQSTGTVGTVSGVGRPMRMVPLALADSKGSRCVAAA